MSQVFHLDVAKVDLDVAYTYMLQEYVSSVSGVSYIYCQCFIRILHMFAMVFKCFLGFLQVFQTFVANVAVVSNICCNVSSRYCKSRSSVAGTDYAIAGTEHVAVQIYSHIFCIIIIVIFIYLIWGKQYN
jgi:hypothetical protein